MYPNFHATFKIYLQHVIFCYIFTRLLTEAGCYLLFFYVIIMTGEDLNKL